MSFEEEWGRLKADALRKGNARTEISAGVAVTAPGAQGVDLGLTDAPIRAKASNLRTAHGDARRKSKLDDAGAVGRTHAGWDAGAASNDCATAWQKRLRELSDLVEDATDALTEAMDRQISDDGSIAARLRKSADWLEDA
ncbi:hypothetical protein ACFRDV_16110 [Streptomyces fagopyri]|uniref:Uncharacterized protein n=1 Tax=Streptomyces fagopyri TaxID=2662397 RepID=A0A5Q0LJN4_9ACTN|nr:hypothetical protein [Streptomyces fagopyri]QFZ76679.1 hypothetical protein GFH48_28510 [Streptomyces fagopyri]